MIDFFEPTQKLIERLKWQFEEYGGFKEFIKSPYFLFSFFITAVEIILGCNLSNKDISQFVFQIVPSALGILVAGISILITFVSLISNIGDKTEKVRIVKYSNQVYITFTHMMLFHVLAILSAIFTSIVSNSALKNVFNIFELWIVNYLVFLYISLALTIKTIGRNSLNHIDIDDSQNE
jgi:hypothetical protein